MPGLLLLTWILGLTAPSVLGQAPETRQLTFLVTSGLSGQLVQDGRTIAAVPALLQELSSAARSEGHGVVVIDAGRTLVPYAESRHDRGQTMAKVLTAAGTQVFAPNPMDFTLGAEALRDFAEAAEFAVLLPFESEDSRLVGLSPKAPLTPLTDVEVEVVSLFDKGLVEDLKFAGIHATESKFEAAPEDQVRDTLRVAVIHSWNLEKTLTGHSPTWDLVESEGTFDLLLDFDLGHNLTLKREGKREPLFLVGRDFDPEATWTVVEIQLELERNQGRWQPRAVHTTSHNANRDLSVDSALDESVQAAFDAFQHDTQRPLPIFPQSIQDDTLQTKREYLKDLVLRALGEATKAEVAVLNEGAFRPVARKYFQADTLQEELIHRFLSIDQRIVVGKLTGMDLKKLYKESEDRLKEAQEGAEEVEKALTTSLRWFGLKKVKKEGKKEPVYEINGRELREKDKYRVVTNAYLNSGGDDYPRLDKMEDLLSAENEPSPEVRDDIVLPRLRSLHSQPFVNLKKRGLWRFGLDEASISFTGVDTSADPAYKNVNDSRARADSSASLQGDFNFRLDQEWPSFRWENRLETTLGLVDSENEEPNESTDNLEFEIAAVFLKAPFGRAHPYASFILDTEFLRNDGPDGQKLARQLEESLTVGLSWSAERWPLIRFAMVARRQDDVETADRLGFKSEAEYKFKASKGRPDFEAEFEAEWLEGAGATVWSMDLQLKAPVKLTNTLKLTPTYNLYLYKDSRLPGLAEYHRFSLGLSYEWIGRRQRW